MTQGYSFLNTLNVVFDVVFYYGRKQWDDSAIFGQKVEKWQSQRSTGVFFSGSFGLYFFSLFVPSKKNRVII
jgi:hypothetical protein